MNVGSVEVLLTLRDKLSAELAKPSANLVKLGAEIRKVENQLAKSELAQIRSARESLKLATATEKAGRSHQQAAADVDRFGRQIRTTLVHVATAGLAYKALAAASASVANQVEFIRTFEKIENITGVTRAEVDQLRASINTLSTTTSKGPQELAEGFYAIASAGIKGAQATEILTESAKASAVGLGETRDIARSITAAINAYGAENLTAAQAANQLFVAVREGGAEASEVAGVFGRVVGVAAQMGVSFAEVGAFIATFTRLGVGADEAVTALRGSIMAMLTPTRAQEEALKALGTSMAELKAKVREQGLTAALVDLIKAAKGNEDAIGAIIPNVRSLAGVLGVAGNQADAYKEIIQKVTGETGALAAGFKDVSESASFKWDQLKAQFEQLSLTLGAALLPGVQAFATALSSIDPSELHDLGTSTASVMSALGEVLKVVVANFDLLKAVIQGLLILKFGAMLSAWVTGLGTASVAAQTATGAFGAMGVSISAITGPIAIAVAALLFLSNKAKEYTSNAQADIERMVAETAAAGRQLDNLRQARQAGVYSGVTVDLDKARADYEAATNAAEGYYSQIKSKEQEIAGIRDKLNRASADWSRDAFTLQIKQREGDIQALRRLANAEEGRKRTNTELLQIGSKQAAVAGQIADRVEAILPPMNAAGDSAGKLSQKLDKVAQALRDSVERATRMREALELVREGMSPERAQELLVVAERLGLSLRDKTVAALVDANRQYEILEAGLAHGDNLVKSMADAALVFAKNLDTAAKASEKVELFGKSGDASAKSGGTTKQVADFLKEWDRGWMTYRDYAAAAFDAVGANLKNALVGWGTGAKDVWKNLWDGLKADAISIFFDMLEQMLRRWIATQTAMAATDYASKSGGAGAKNVGKGGGASGYGGQAAGAYSTASGAGVSTSAMAGAAVIAFGLYVVYRAFIEDHKRKFAEITISGGAANITAAHGKKYLQGVQDAASALLKTLHDWMKSVDVMMTSFGTVTIGHDKDNWWVRGPAGYQQAFKTAEEALSAAQAVMIRFGEFAAGVPPLVQSAIRSIQSLPDFNMEEVNSRVAFARTLLTQNMEQVALAMHDATQLFVDQMRRSFEMFGNVSNLDLGALTEATGSAILYFTSSLQALYNQLTGVQEDPRVAAERQRQAYNMQRIIMLAQLQLLYMEIEARVADMRSRIALLALIAQNPGGNLGRGTGTGNDGGAGNGQGSGRGGAGGKGGGILVVDSRNPTNDPQLAQLIAILDNLARALQGLPPEIAPGGVKPGRGGRGGGRGSERQGARDFLADRQFQFALQGMDELHARLAQINRDYQDQLEAAGKDAALRAQLIALRDQETAAAIAAFQKQTKARYDELVGNTNAFTQLRDKFDEVRKAILAAGYGADEAAAMIARLAEAEMEAARLLSDQLASDLLGGLAGYIEDAVIKQELLRQQSIIKFNMEMAQFRAQYELLRAQGHLTQASIDAIEGALAWIAANGNLLPGGLGAGGAPGFHPFTGANSWSPGTQLASGQWSNVYIANGQRWAWFGDPMSGHWVNLGAAPTGGGGDSGSGGGTDPNAAWIAARKRALDLLEQYRNQGLNRWLQALKKLNDDFATIRAALGNTPEVAQAYADALARLREEFLSGIRDFYDNMLTGAGSPLTTEQRFNEARNNYQRLLALVQGGDLSQADALRQAAELFQSLAAQMFGTSTGGYSAIFDQIRNDLAALLGINVGAGGNVIGGPQWFAQGSASQVTAIGNAGTMTVASITGLSNVVDMASYRQEAILERIDARLADISFQQGAGSAGVSANIAIGVMPTRSVRR